MRLLKNEEMLEEVSGGFGGSSTTAAARFDA
jgi:hypothetical protein